MSRHLEMVVVAVVVEVVDGMTLIHSRLPRKEELMTLHDEDNEMIDQVVVHLGIEDPSMVNVTVDHLGTLGGDHRDGISREKSPKLVKLI